jgi:hypothetical protein
VTVAIVIVVALVAITVVSVIIYALYLRPRELRRVALATRSPTGPSFDRVADAPTSAEHDGDDQTPVRTLRGPGPLAVGLSSFAALLAIGAGYFAALVVDNL